MKYTQENYIELSPKDIEAIRISEEQLKRGEGIPFEEVFKEFRNPKKERYL